MTGTKNQTMQVRIGPKTTEPFKEWFSKQISPNDSGKRVVEHFIRLYGTGDIDSDDVQIKMARDLLMSKGEMPSAISKPQNSNDVVRKEEVKEIVEEVKPPFKTKESDGGKVSKSEVKPVRNRGEMNL